jgi:single-stranded-DNA-specific exonuclease
MLALGDGRHAKLFFVKNGIGVTAVYFGVSPMQLKFYTNEPIDVLFQLNVNEYQGERSVQLIVQDIRLSERFSREQERLKQRYEEIRAGAPLLPEEEASVIPDREDFAHVYTFLRREFRQGSNAFPERALLAALQGEFPVTINYIKLKYILRILEELKICGVDEPTPGFYMFDVYFTPTKTAIDKSSILKKLKSQCKKK